MKRFVRRVREAGCLIISGLCSAAGIGGMMTLVFLFFGTAQGAVSYSDDGTYIVMSNSLAKIKIIKAEARVKEFNLGDSPNLLRYVPGVAGAKKGMYFHSSLAGVSNGVTLCYDDLLLISNTNSSITVTSGVSSSKCWVRFKQEKMGPPETYFSSGLFDFELNFVMRDNEPGFYSYLVVRHKSGQKAARLIYPRHMVAGADLFGCMPDNPFNYKEYSTTNRIGLCVNWDWRTEDNDLGEDVGESCYVLPESAGYYSTNEILGETDVGDHVWTKYDWGFYQGDTTAANPVFGVAAMTNATKGYGLWVACGSREFFNGGPTKMKAGAQGSNLVIDYSENHASAGELHDASVGENEVLTKIFGPVYVFANTTNTTTDAMWTNAQAIANQKVTDWPYTWVNESSSVYPASRGTVEGNLKIKGTSAANATIVLASPTASTTINTNISPWRAQGVKDYLFWTKTDANGDFSIPKVRAGTYNLYAFAPGHFGEAKVTDITVTAGSTNDIGSVDWTPWHYGKLLWRLGTPDRSAGEFKWGDTNKQFGLWWDYLDAQDTNELVYTIGESDEGSDWYYAQMISALPTWAYSGDPVGNKHYSEPKWTIKFNLASIPTNNPTLTVALAGAQTGKLQVRVNDNLINGEGEVLTDDSSAKRSAIISAWYQLYTVAIPDGELTTGWNSISFTLYFNPISGGSNDWYGITNTMPQLPPRAVMYDCVQLTEQQLHLDKVEVTPPPQ